MYFELRPAGNSTHPPAHRESALRAPGWTPVLSQVPWERNGWLSFMAKYTV